MKKDKLLPIGYISKSLGVSEKTIRRMESEGLLKPACLNTSTGYRFYDSDNLSRAAVILGIKTFGFTNREIGEYLKEPDNNSSLYNSLMQKSALLIIISVFWIAVQMVPFPNSVFMRVHTTSVLDKLPLCFMILYLTC